MVQGFNIVQVIRGDRLGTNAVKVSSFKELAERVFGAAAGRYEQRLEGAGDVRFAADLAELADVLDLLRGVGEVGNDLPDPAPALRHRLGGRDLLAEGGGLFGDLLQDLPRLQAGAPWRPPP